MGQTSVTVRVENAIGKTVRVVETAALIDPEANHLQLPTGLVEKLRLESFGTRMKETADGQRVRCRYVGPIRLQINHSQGFLGAIEFGDQIVLGHIALSALALRWDVVDSRLKTVCVRV